MSPFDWCASAPVLRGAVADGLRSHGDGYGPHTTHRPSGADPVPHRPPQGQNRGGDQEVLRPLGCVSVCLGLQSTHHRVFRVQGALHPTTPQCPNVQRSPPFGKCPFWAEPYDPPVVAHKGEIKLHTYLPPIPPRSCLWGLLVGISRGESDFWVLFFVFLILRPEESSPPSKKMKHVNFFWHFAPCVNSLGKFRLLGPKRPPKSAWRVFFSFVPKYVGCMFFPHHPWGFAPFGGLGWGSYCMIFKG